MKRMNGILSDVLAAREKTLTLKVKGDRKRILNAIDTVLAEIALAERGWARTTKPKKGKKS